MFSENSEKKFWNLLDEGLELCYEALMCRHYALKGTFSDLSPIHWQYGAISRLKKGEYINQLLYNGNSSLSLGYIGIDEIKEFMSIQEKFEDKVIKYLLKTAQKWSKENDIEFVLERTNK